MGIWSMTFMAGTCFAAWTSAYQSAESLTAAGYLRTPSNSLKSISLTNQHNNSIMTIKEQYDQIKAQHLDAIILFRVGDFYEVYYEDAEKASKTLSVTLTHRGDGTPLCGFPFHALDSYLPKLVRAGYRVAICDYQEEPKPDRFTKYGVTETVEADSKEKLPAGLTQQTATQLLLLQEQLAECLLQFRDEVAKVQLADIEDLSPDEAVSSANDFVKSMCSIFLMSK